MSAELRQLDQGIALLEVGQPQQGLLLLKDFLAGDPDNALALSHLSRAYLDLDDPRQAAQAARRSLSLGPDNEFALRLLALSSARLKDRATAIHAAEAAQRMAPFNWMTHFVRADVDVTLRRRSVAGRRASAEALRLAPDITGTHMGAANYIICVDGLSTTRARKLARRHLIRALAIDPQHSSAHVMLASLDLINGWRTASATERMLGALALDPTNSANRARLFFTITANVKILVFLFIVLLYVVLGIGRSVNSGDPYHLLATYPFASGASAGIALLACAAVLGRFAWVLRGRAVRLLRNVPHISVALTIRLICIAFALIALLILPLVPLTIGLPIGSVALALLVLSSLTAHLAGQMLNRA
jgi:tetratricopeptide (TPR) repeat protein